MRAAAGDARRRRLRVVRFAVRRRRCGGRDPRPVRRRRRVPDRSAVRQRAELHFDGLHAGGRRRHLPGRHQLDPELPGRWTAGLPRRLFGGVRVRGAARRLRDAQLRVRDRALFARNVSRGDGHPRRLRRAVARGAALISGWQQVSPARAAAGRKRAGQRGWIAFQASEAGEARRRVAAGAGCASRDARRSVACRVADAQPRRRAAAAAHRRVGDTGVRVRVARVAEVVAVERGARDAAGLPSKRRRRRWRATSGRRSRVSRRCRGRARRGR